MGRGPTPIEFLSDDHRATIGLFLAEMRMGVGSEATE